MQWRDGAAELARVIHGLTPSRGVAETLVTGKPITLITRSLIEEVPTFRRSPALSMTGDVTIARAPRGGHRRSRALAAGLADRHALAVFAMAALFGTLAAIVV